MRRIGNGVASTVITRFRYKLLEAYPIYLHGGSDIVYLNVLGQSIIVIDKYETAVELLDKRSGSYSSRFVTPRSFSHSQERRG
jgi:hypothetical protein